ncbi:hypothetical protein OAK75_13825, partial [Bacteriovoracales bacterium]|nr:hypothetical protein [Bacteriovoracales bacterium]
MRKELKEDMFHIFKFRPWEKIKLVREIDKLLSESDLNIFSHYNPKKWHFSGIARKVNVQNNKDETQKIEKYYKGNVLIIDKSYDMKT